MKKQFTLTAVKPLKQGTLHLTYADGQQFSVDISSLIKRSKALWPLQQPDIFSSAQLGDFGSSVIFAGNDNLELAADNLRARAIEQQGDYSYEYLFAWISRHALTQQQAAMALGLSRRMLAYYLSGAKPLPRTVALACIGWETMQLKKAA